MIWYANLKAKMQYVRKSNALLILLYQISTKINRKWNCIEINYLLRQEKKRIAANIVTNNIDLYLISIWFQFNWNDSIELIQMSTKNEIDQKTESIENTKYSVRRKNIRTMTIILNEWRDNMLVNFSLACSYWNRVIFAKYICENVQLHCLNWLVHASCNWQFGSHPKMSFFD